MPAPIRGAVEEAPLPVCDARSIEAGDLVPTDLIYEDRSGEVYSLVYGPQHRWFYHPRVRADEAMLLKCYDSACDRALPREHRSPHARVLLVRSPRTGEVTESEAPLDRIW